MTKFVPVTDRVVVRLEPRAEKTDGGIIVAGGIEKPRTVGVVEGIGPEVTADVKIGDKVLFHCFDELPGIDDEVVVIRDNSLLGVIDEK